MGGFKTYLDQQLTEGRIKINYEWNRPLDGSEKALSKKYGITIKVINQMHAEITGENKKILNFLQHEDDLIKADPDMLDVLYSELVEAIRKLPDEKADKFIKDEWDGAATYEYNIHAAAEIAKLVPDVIITQDNKYMYLPSILRAHVWSKIDDIIAKYNVKCLDESFIAESSFLRLKDLIEELQKHGYKQYKNVTPNKMHEYTNNKKIVSLGQYKATADEIDVFRIRDFDINNGNSFKPKNIEEFIEIIK